MVFGVNSKSSNFYMNGLPIRIAKLTNWIPEGFQCY